MVRASGSARHHGFSGAASVVWSTLVEVIWSSVMAPIMLLYQSRSVLQIVTGSDGGWPVSDREDGISLTESWAGSWWISAAGILALSVAGAFTPDLLPWLLPVGIPMVLAPLIIYGSSTRGSGLAAARLGLFGTPTEIAPPKLVLDRRAVLARWTGQPQPSRENAGARVAIPAPGPLP